MKNNKGFQIIELLIVLGLAAILFGMVITIGYKAVKEANYTGAVNRLLAEISYVKNLAIQENRYVMLEFSDDGNSYSIKKQLNVADRDTITVLVRSSSFLQTKSLKEFFDSGSFDDYSFVSNSRGMIFKKSDINGTTPNPVPSVITIPVYFKNNKDEFERKDTIIINPSGGVNVKNTKKSFE